MKKKAGLWIDGGKAVIFSMADEGSEIKRISAITGEAVSSPGAMKKKTDGKKEGKLSDGRLKTYYDEVISYIRDAEFLLLFGPGNTKTELKKQLEDAGFSMVDPKPALNTNHGNGNYFFFVHLTGYFGGISDSMR